MRDEVSRLVAEGKSREQVYEYYIAKFGSQEPLASPIDKRLQPARLVRARISSAPPERSALRMVALRWSRRAAGPSGQAARRECAAGDPDLDARLNDELRDLD